MHLSPDYQAFVHRIGIMYMYHIWGVFIYHRGVHLTLQYGPQAGSILHGGGPFTI